MQNYIVLREFIVSKGSALGVAFSVCIIASPSQSWQASHCASEAYQDQAHPVVPCAATNIKFSRFKGGGAGLGGRVMMWC